MVEVYLRDLKSLLDPVTPRLEVVVAVDCKHFFSGAAAYADGRIFMTLTPAGLALKLPEEARDALIERGATKLRYFPTGPIKKDYVVLPQALASDESALASWIMESIRHARNPAR